MTNFAKRLRSLRENKGMTQRELAEIIGRSKEAMSKYESGDREPDLDTIIQLAGIYNVTVDYLLALSDEPVENHNENTSEGSGEPFCHCGLEEFEPYLHEDDFNDYLRLAVRMKDNGISAEQMESILDSIIKMRNMIKEEG